MSKRSKKRKKRAATQFLAQEATQSTPLPISIWRKVTGFIRQGGTGK